MNVRIFGIRHHSPACARRVGEIIRTEKPRAVLIEGPSDFNPRRGELSLGHSLPIAIYSYAHTEHGAAQCWYPFLDYSPEWVALRTGLETGAAVRFIDLPHWRDRALGETRWRAGDAQALRRNRYAEVEEALCRRFKCDGTDTLWDHLFESAPEEELDARLDLYFAELRGDDPGEDDDALREDFMARCIAATVAEYGNDPNASILVVCGGWHRPALEKLWRSHHRTGESAFPEVPIPEEGGSAGSYLVPFEFRQVEALAGYGAGMQSPRFYQWCWERGAEYAVDQAIRAVIGRFRERRIGFSTADFVGLRQSVEGLARLRGHAVPTRADVLDAFLASGVKEALDRRPAWSERGSLTSADHPVLREALLVLTGEGRGRLDGATPQPPLVRDAERILAEQDLMPKTQPRTVTLDRRENTGNTRAEILWRLKLLKVGGVSLRALQAARTARNLPEHLRYEEHWTLVQNERWYPDLIEASLHGASLAQAAENALLASVRTGEGGPFKLASALIEAIRAGFGDLGTRLAIELRGQLPLCHDHGELAQAGWPLLELAQHGFWGQDIRDLILPSLTELGERLLWLLEGHQAVEPNPEPDADAVRLLADLVKAGLPDFDTDFVRSTLARLARRHGGPAALRGAALGAAHGFQTIAASEVLTILRAVPPKDELGDFLYGLFATARELATSDPTLVEAIHGALEALSADDFLIALPALRSAFHWFPPRERGAIAARVAELLGISGMEQIKLLRLPKGPEALVDAKRVEARAMEWAREIGLVE